MNEERLALPAHPSRQRAARGHAHCKPLVFSLLLLPIKVDGTRS